MQVLCMGEALIDMLASEERVGNDNTAIFRRFAGGAPANVAVAVAKLGGDSGLFGKLGKDQFGTYLHKALGTLGVNTRFTGFSEYGKTALAFVGLDADGERSFDFYIENAAHTDLSTTDLLDELFDRPRIVSYCSGSFSSHRLREVSAEATARFRQAGSILCLDINYRHAFWDDTALAPQIISDAAGQADIIKASREELVALYGEGLVEEKIAQWLQCGASLVLLTDGACPVTFYSSDTDGTFPTPSANVVDTTAAGDAFVGGFLFTVSRQVNNRDGFAGWVGNFENILQALRFATQCGAVAVARYGAFDALPDKADMAEFL